MTEFEDLFGTLESPKPVKNPYKVISPLDTNCILKAAFAGGAGGVMGMGMALFMNAMTFREMEMVSNVRESTKRALKSDFKRMVGTARGFAVFGGLYVLFECQLEKLRKRSDPINAFWAGAFTSVVLSINVMGPRALMGTGLVGGAVCVCFERLMDSFHLF